VPLRPRLSPLHACLGLAQAALHGLIVRAVALSEADVRQHGREDVVDLVSKQAGDGPEGRPLLQLDDLVVQRTNPLLDAVNHRAQGGGIGFVGCILHAPETSGGPRLGLADTLQERRNRM
jgi:hypothetical protein